MKTVEVVLDIYTLSLESSRITGSIFLRTEDDSIFPEPNWNDFVCVIISWWLNSSRNIQIGVEEETFMFMDGPLKYVVWKEKGKFNFSFWHRERLMNTIEDVDYDYFNKSLINAATLLLANCHNKGFISNDINELENSLTLSY